MAAEAWQTLLAHSASSPDLCWPNGRVGLIHLLHDSAALRICLNMGRRSRPADTPEIPIFLMAFRSACLIHAGAAPGQHLDKIGVFLYKITPI